MVFSTVFSAKNLSVIGYQLRKSVDKSVFFLNRRPKAQRTDNR